MNNNMRWDLLFFAMFLYPTTKGLFYYVIGKSDEVRNKRKALLDSLLIEKRLIKISLRQFIVIIPYFGAYYYAEYKYLWLTLGILYLISTVITLIAAKGSQALMENSPNEYKKMRNKGKKQFKNVNFWPRWQVHALCIFNVSIFVLWFYSWRNIFA